MFLYKIIMQLQLLQLMANQYLNNFEYCYDATS